MERLNVNELEEISFATVKEIWKKNIMPISVYIHNPFCLSICDFCAYKGSIPVSGALETYYAKYLPYQIQSYKYILKNNKISSWFFGGGTPSLITPNYLRNILDLLPNIKKYGEKTFEIHPAKFNVELLDILQEYNFNNIIIGVQSFNSQVLSKTNRIPASEEQIKKIVEEVHRRKMNVWIDIVGLINDDPSEINIFKEDILKAIKLNPDEISICTNFFCKNKHIGITVKMLSEILKNLPLWNIYEMNDDFSEKTLKAYFLKKKAIRLLNRSKNIINSCQFIKDIDLPDSQKTVSVLGIGSYENENRETFSLCVTSPSLKKYTYIERTHNGKRYFFKVIDKNE